MCCAPATYMVVHRNACACASCWTLLTEWKWGCSATLTHRSASCALLLSAFVRIHSGIGQLQHQYSTRHATPSTERSLASCLWFVLLFDSSKPRIYVVGFKRCGTWHLAVLQLWTPSRHDRKCVLCRHVCLYACCGCSCKQGAAAVMTWR